MMGREENLSEDEIRRRRIAVGQCSFMLVSVYSTVAICCGMSATAWCDFFHRDIVIADPYNVTSGCDALGLQQTTCDAFLNNHAIGFYAWQVTVPVNQVFCTSYTQEIENVGWIEPDFDSKFKAVRAFATIANVFGLFAWFTFALASCCPLTQDRLKGMSLYFFLASFFQGMTLLLFRSDVCKVGFFKDYFIGTDVEDNIDEVIADVECSLDRGARLAIVACVFYFLSMNQIPTVIAPPPIGYYRAATTDGAAPAANVEGGDTQQ